MKHFSAASVLLALLLVTTSTLGDARKDRQEYWNAIVKGESMPQVIKNLLSQSVPESHSDQKFIYNFDTKPNVIIYHTRRVDTQGEKSPVKEVDVSVAKRGKATAN